jgi:Uma2 family endonuclease
MSTLPRHPAEWGYAGLRMDADEFFSLGETFERLELIDGVVTVSPSPLPVHGEIVQEVLTQLGLQKRSGATIRTFTEIDVRLSDRVVYRPDISVYLASRLPPHPQRLTLPPDIVIEILSPGTMAADLITKRDDYGRFGVGEYWAIDPADASIRLWRKRPAGFVQEPAPADRVESAAVPELTLDLAPIRALIAPQ